MYSLSLCTVMCYGRVHTGAHITIMGAELFKTIAAVIQKNMSKSLKEVDRSFMYMRKRKGPNRLPWGTPGTTGRIEELQLLIHGYRRLPTT